MPKPKNTNFLNKSSVLVLNSAYFPIGTCTVKKAIIAMNSSQDGENYAAKGLQIEYPEIGGKYDFSKPCLINPISFLEWINLEVRSFDTAIHTTKLTIRVPNVIIVLGFTKIPMKNLKPTLKNIRKRDEDRCQYSNKKLNKKSMTLDHVISKDEWKKTKKQGTPDSWTNLVLADKKINFYKSNKKLNETNLKLIKQPKSPLPILASSLIVPIENPDWKIFLK